MIPDPPSKLTVILPNFNDGRYVGRALEAMVSQSYPADEIIVIDDGSTDESLSVLERIASRERSIRLLRNDRNRGVVYSSNRGLELASGEYVYFASSNDRVLPGFFEKSIRLLRMHPQAALCCSDFIVYFDSDTLFTRKLHGSMKEGYYSPSQFSALLRKDGGYIPGASTIVRRSDIIRAGNYAQGLSGHSDWFAYLVLAFRSGLCYVPEPLVAYRRGLHGSLSSKGRIWPLQRETIRSLLDLLKSPPYRDVLPLFHSTASLYFIPSILRALLEGGSPHRDLLSPLLLRRSAWTELRRLVIAVMPLWFWRACCKFRNTPISPSLLHDDYALE